MATAIIIDPAVRDYSGHHFAAVTGWAEAARRYGLDSRILAHSECIIESAGSVPIEKIFRGSFYEAAPAEQQEAWMRLRIMQREFRRSLAKPLLRATRNDVIILAHSTLVTLNGVAAWASGMQADQLPRLTVWLMMEPEGEDFVAPLGSVNCIVAAMHRLRALFGDRLALAGFTKQVCTQYETLGFGPVHFLPFIALRPALAARTVARQRTDHTPATPPQIALLGHMGPSKGLHLMPALIKELNRRAVPLRWVIGGASFGETSCVLKEIEDLSKIDPNINLVTQSAGVEDYDALIKSSDLILLPYSPDVYRLRGSGISEEAELLGLPYIAPIAPFSAEGVSAGAAVSFEAWTVEGIADAVVEAANELQLLTHRAQKLALRRHEALQEIQEQTLPLLMLSGEDLKPSPAAPMLPGVDIIVTLHNYRHFLAQCLDSVRRQSYPNWRCIVVDDGSTDLDFEELRATVTKYGERFTFERHANSAGQIKAIATGLSLGSNPFVVMLDADDCLTDHALDQHLSWHLNSRIPAAFTCGQMFVIDEIGRPLAGCMDNIVWLHHSDSVTELPPAAAYRWPDSAIEPASASFVFQGASKPGQWFWSATSAMMFRRTMMELILPDSIDLGKYAGDTYFAYGAHAIGGSILIDAHVGMYRRHGANGFADTGVYGAGTMAQRPNGSNWALVSQVLRDHVQNNLAEFNHQIAFWHIERLLAQTAPSAAKRAWKVVSKRQKGDSIRLVGKNKAKLKFGQKVAREVNRIVRQIRALGASTPKAG